MIRGVDHIAIAVHSLEESLLFYRDQLGLELLGIEEIADQKVRVALLDTGATRIELLEPLGDDSPISNFLAKRGPGLHHIAFQSGDGIADNLNALKSSGVQLIDETPRVGAEGKKIAFVHPRSTGGVLLELCEEPDQ